MYRCVCTCIHIYMFTRTQRCTHTHPRARARSLRRVRDDTQEGSGAPPGRPLARTKESVRVSFEKEARAGRTHSGKGRTATCTAPPGASSPPKAPAGQGKVSTGRSGNPGLPGPFRNPLPTPTTPPSTPPRTHATRACGTGEGRECDGRASPPGVLALKRGVQGTASAWGPAPPAAPPEAESPFRTERKVWSLRTAAAPPAASSEVASKQCGP